MLDKNGKEIKAGDIVKVSGAYFKKDNGLYFVEQDGTNEAYMSHDEITIYKINRNGKISTGKYNLNFFPLNHYCSDRRKNAEAYEHDKKHCTIEIVDGVDRTEVLERFENEVCQSEESAEWYEIRGYGEDFYINLRKKADYFRRAIANMTA